MYLLIWILDVLEGFVPLIRLGMEA